MRQWKESAKRKLGERFREVVERGEEVGRKEREVEEAVNAEVLRGWAERARRGWGLDEKISVLGEVVDGVWGLGEGNGKFSRVVGRFERWIGWCEGVLAAREEGDLDEVVFVEGLGGEWEIECSQIGRKLEGWRELLKGFREGEAGSVGRVVDGYRTLVKGMLEQLRVMGEIEREVMKREREWVRMMNDRESDDDNAHTAGACWRRG